MSDRRAPRFKEPQSREGRCSCGGSSNLVKRKIFMHGRKSGGTTIMEYVCLKCSKRTLLVHGPTKKRF